MMKDRTKKMFAEELERMLVTTPFDKIRVSELCKRCNTIYPTFYYHFRDKYELVAWIYVHDFVETMGSSISEYSADVLESVIKNMVKKKAFYKKVFTDKSQNSIESYSVEFNIKLATSAVRYYTGADSLTDEQMIAARFHSYGIMGLFRDYIFDVGNITVESMAAFNFEHTPDFLKEAYSHYPYSEDDLLAGLGRSRQKRSH